MKDAIARNYDAVEDGGELFLIAVRRSGSFCQAGRLDAQQSLSARSVGNLICAWARYLNLRSPYPYLSWSTNERALHVHIRAASPKGNRARRTRQGFSALRKRVNSRPEGTASSF